MTIAVLLVLALANWRISSFLYTVDYEGPWEILHRLRSLMGVTYDQLSRPVGTNVVAQGILCPECCPIWVGIAQVAVYILSPSLAVILCLPFALGAASLLITRKSL
jgi:hypothetical protein